MEIMKESEAKKQVELEFIMRDFTQHVNKTLRVHEIVKDWGFTVNLTHGYALHVWIDYHASFHSRDVYEMDMYDIERLKRQFDHYFNKHLTELEELCRMREIRSIELEG